MFAHAYERCAMGDRLLPANPQIRLVGQLARQIRLVVTARSTKKDHPTLPGMCERAAHIRIEGVVCAHGSMNNKKFARSAGNGAFACTR
jgi:hypothetical protein